MIITTTTTTTLAKLKLCVPISQSNPCLFEYRRKHRFSSNSNQNNKLTNPITLVNNTTTTSSSDTKVVKSSLKDEQINVVGEGNVPVEGVIRFDKPNSNTFNKWSRIALLAGGDVLALLLFSSIGRLSHGFSVFDAETLHTADPFISGWFLSAYFLGGYGEDGRGMNGYSNAVIAAAKSWALGIPAGVGIRAVTIGHLPPLNFILVTMGSTAVLLIGWRALLGNILSSDNTSKKDDVYKRGSPFELFGLLTSLIRRW